MIVYNCSTDLIVYLINPFELSYSTQFTQPVNSPIKSSINVKDDLNCLKSQRAGTRKQKICGNIFT